MSADNEFSSEQVKTWTADQQATLLVNLAHQNKVDEIKSLARNGVNPHLQLPDGNCALFTAVMMANVQLVEYLLKVAGFNQAMQFNNLASELEGLTPVYAAVEIIDLATSERILDLLIVNGFKADALVGEFQAIHRAVICNNPKAIELLHLKAGIDLNERTASTYRSPLHLAAEYDRVIAAELLLLLDADKNNKNNDFGLTPFMVAVILGHTQVMKVLLDYNIDLDLLAENNYSVIDIAYLFGERDSQKFIEQSDNKALRKLWAQYQDKRNKNKNFLDMIKSGNLPIAQQMFDEFAGEIDLSFFDEEEMTPLSTALHLSKNHEAIFMPIIEWLEEQGAKATPSQLKIYRNVKCMVEAYKQAAIQSGKIYSTQAGLKTGTEYLDSLEVGGSKPSNHQLH